MGRRGGMTKPMERPKGEPRGRMRGTLNVLTCKTGTISLGGKENSGS